MTIPNTAILDLMAKHALRGEFTFYYWGEGYYGMLEHFSADPAREDLRDKSFRSQTVPWF